MTLSAGIRAELLGLVVVFVSAAAGGLPPGGERVRAADAPQTFAQIARKVPRPAGFPRASAVCFSSRFKHPANAQDPHDTFQAANDFHATGFYWIMGPDKEWFQEIRRRGYPYQGWLSTILPDRLFGSTRQQGRILNEQGELVTGPWMRAFQGWWGCLNSPEYRAVYLDYVKMYLDAGAESLQMDDPGENATAVQWGGCFCPHCRAKAARLGKSPPEIQQESTVEFYRWMRAEMDAYAGRHVPFSCNSRPGDRYFLDEVFDFGLAELAEGRARPAALYQSVRDAERRGKAQMFTYVSRETSLTRAVIGLAYACGSHIIVPWDVYLGTGLPRYFGRPEDYADLYGFARANAAYLDGYEDAACLIPQQADDRYEQAPLAVRGGAPNLNLFVRAVPGDAAAPVVIHCVNTEQAPQPFRLGIHPARFFGDRPVTVDLLVPASYERAAHERAEQTQDFAQLSVRKRLAAGYVTEVDVPAISPWGLIVVAPQPDAPTGIWPPAVLTDDAGVYSATLAVTLDSATPGAVIRYSLDGTEPTASSAPYERPLELTADTTLRARAFRQAAASEVTTVSFRRTSAVREPTAPTGIAGLCLWLRADDLAKSHPAGAPVARWPAQAGPAMAAEPVTLADGQKATAPTFEPHASKGQPAVRFRSGSDLLVIRDFANQHLGGAFTVFLVTCAEDPLFGVCGNALNGNGGVPRLYLMRDGFTYHASGVQVGTLPNEPAIAAYTHDGADAIAVWLNGTRAAAASGPEYAAVGRFGGGHLAIPFWCGNAYHGGAVAEVIAFDRQLDDAQRQGIERYLAQKYRLRTVRMWQ